MPQSQRPVDELRDQLRSLGYLDARVDRFVLGSASARARPAAFVLAASARIGLLAGVLLGPAAAAGVRLRAPELVTNATDVIVLAVYLAVLFGVAAWLAAAAAIGAGVALARTASRRPGFARRARIVAGAAGLIVGLACLAYLTLWWRTTSGASGSASLAWSAVGLAIAAAISLMLGHAVTATILAVLARLGLGGSLPRGLPLSSMKATIPLGAVALAGAVLMLMIGDRDRARTEATPSLTVVSPGYRVMVIAVDGVDAPTLDRLRAAGRLPLFDALLSNAVAAMPSDRDRDPARVWTTVATGQSPERHGIRSLESRQVAGLEGRLNPASSGLRALTTATDLVRLTRPSIASGDERLIPAFWEIAARAGLRTAVIHWWATWPAPDDLGIVISDRAILRLERGGALDGEIAPASLYPALAAGWTARRDRAARRAAELAGGPGSSEAVAALRRSAELDATLIDLASDPALDGVDLLVLYLPGLDIAQHALLGSSEGAAVAPSALSSRVSAIEGYYAFLDAALSSLVTRTAKSDRLLALVTQPGRVAAPSDGLLGLTGPAASRARAAAAPTSVAATVLHAIGLPVAADLASGPALELFAPDFLRAHPVRHVTTYGTRAPAARAGTGRALDREMVERMRSLGYVR